MNHLFLLVANNSGSTLLHNLLKQSPDVSVLPYEGQLDNNWRGPHPIKLGVRHIFTEKESIFRDPAQYDWEHNKTYWDSVWSKYNPTAKVRLEKSPPNIVRTDMLLEHFADVKFISMIRNPYAMFEGIQRGNQAATDEQAMRHAIRVIEIGNENRKLDNCLFFTYEQLTTDTKAIVDQIEGFLGIEGVDFSQPFRAKEYVRPIENLNEEQIDRIIKLPHRMKLFRSILEPHEDLLKAYGYDIL